MTKTPAEMQLALTANETADAMREYVWQAQSICRVIAVASDNSSRAPEVNDIMNAAEVAADLLGNVATMSEHLADIIRKEVRHD